MFKWKFDNGDPSLEIFSITRFGDLPLTKYGDCGDFGLIIPPVAEEGMLVDVGLTNVVVPNPEVYPLLFCRTLPKSPGPGLVLPNATDPKLEEYRFTLVLELLLG